MLEQLLKSLQGPQAALPQPVGTPASNAWTPSVMPSGMAEGATRDPAQGGGMDLELLKKLAAMGQLPPELMAMLSAGPAMQMGGPAGQPQIPSFGAPSAGNEPSWEPPKQGY